MKEHKCNRMQEHAPLNIKRYYDHVKERHIYYCHYCGTELVVYEKENESH